MTPPMSLIKSTLAGALVCVFGQAPLMAQTGNPHLCPDLTSNTVDEVYPSAYTLPQNILRFYIYFDQPVIGASPKVFVKDRHGRTIDGVFLSNRFELWSSDRTRLTLLLDPGRVKTGLHSNREFGSAFEVGKDYRLVVEPAANVKDCSPEQVTIKSFSIVKPDTEAPAPERWGTKAPVVDSREALKVHLNGMHDHLSVVYRVRVIDQNDDILPGRISLANNERDWLFTPNDPWRTGRYMLVVDPALEDVAGNNVTGRFDKPSKKSSRVEQLSEDDLAVEFFPVLLTLN